MPSAQKDLDGFSGKILSKIKDVIVGLYENPHPHHSKKLKGGSSQWRVRVGDYRVLYEIDNPRKVVKVYRIAHRREVYR
jgi:mRNA interferase RelE/StbE